MLLKDFLKEGVQALESLYPTAEARNIMLMLCEYRLGTKSYTHIVEPEYDIKDKSMEPLRKDLERLTAGEPVQYVIGSAEFCGLKFKVTPDVLIPRPETEMLCRHAVKLGSRMQRMREAYGKSAKPVNILDLCTGSGCIAWTVALSIPGCEVTGVDISEAAVKVAASQDFAQRLKETDAKAPQFIVADVLQTEQEFSFKEFDLILSNPPYIMDAEKQNMRANVLNFEPSAALFVPDDDPLLYYRAIARWSERFLAAEGKGITEINELFGPEVETVFRKSGFTEVETTKDFYEKNRFVAYSR